MSFTVLVTVGPNLLSEEKLKLIDSLGDCYFRINGAHANSEQTKEIIGYIRNCLPQSKIVVDLPGNKIRTNNLTSPITLVKGEGFELNDFQINFTDFYKYVKKGDVIYANDSIYKLEVLDVNNKKIKLLSHSDGVLLTNKGLHVPRIYKDLPFLFQRDKNLIEAGCKYNADFVSISFVRTAEDVQEVLNEISTHDNNKIKVIAKIETAMAMENLKSILELVEYANIDRGDLSADIGILNLPAAQEKIVDIALAMDKKIFLATQFLKNMEVNPVPLIAEIVDLYKTAKRGVSGIQLSEETAVGKYPVECVRLVFDTIKNLNQ